MARYFSVEEAAGILGTTERTVRRMLNAGKLAGSQHMDKGKLVWRVHASKEILQKIPQIVDEPLEAEAAATEVDTAPVETEVDASPGWRQDSTERASAAVDEFWNQIAAKFLDKIEQKDQTIGALRVELTEKERQLRLLPDLQKQLQIEQEQRNLSAQESAALHKQIEALKVVAEEERAVLELELKSSKNEKEEELSKLKEELSALKKEVNNLRKPWWQKLFGPAEGSPGTDG